MSDFQKLTLKKWAQFPHCVRFYPAGVWYDKVYAGAIRGCRGDDADYCRRVRVVYGGFYPLGLAVAGQVNRERV